MYFRSEPLRLQFERGAARREGFAIGSAVDREMSELPYGVILHIICPLKKRSVDEVTVLCDTHCGAVRRQIDVLGLVRLRRSR